MNMVIILRTQKKVIKALCIVVLGYAIFGMGANLRLTSHRSSRLSKYSKGGPVDPPNAVLRSSLQMAQKMPSSRAYSKVSC